MKKSSRIRRLSGPPSRSNIIWVVKWIVISAEHHALDLLIKFLRPRLSCMQQKDPFSFFLFVLARLLFHLFFLLQLKLQNQNFHKKKIFFTLSNKNYSTPIIIPTLKARINKPFNCTCDTILFAIQILLYSIYEELLKKKKKKNSAEAETKCPNDLV